jgi:hypothetical protein
MELPQTITDVLSVETLETLATTLALAAVVALLIHFCGKLMKTSAPFHVSPLFHVWLTCPKSFSNLTRSLESLLFPCFSSLLLIRFEIAFPAH